MRIIEKDDIDSIVKAFNDNCIVVMATDTVYGFMARACRDNEIKINELKNRDIDQHVQIVFPNKDMLFSYIKYLPYYKKELMEEKLPGKYSFILNLNDFSDYGREEFGVRVTSYDYLQDIIKRVGPVCATSCNIHGEDSLNDLNMIIDRFNDSDIVIVNDKVDFEDNKSSTIISLINDIEIIR